MTAEFEFETWDVFTDTRFAGNPLAVVFDADRLDDGRMLAVTREFDYSESVFVQAPRTLDHDWRLRIFTPAGELPFAGHPTVGAACALAQRRGSAGALRLELGAGSFWVETQHHDASWRAQFINPNLPRIVGPGPDGTEIAAAVGLAGDCIDDGRAAPRRAGAGIDFIYARCSGPDLARARLDAAAFDKLALSETCGLLLYSIDSQGLEHRVRARMFAPHIGVPEDPATGSAAAALPAHLLQQGVLIDGIHRIEVLQGQDMGRPSRIELVLEIVDGHCRSVRVAGQAVRVMRGVIAV